MLTGCDACAVLPIYMLCNARRGKQPFKQESASHKPISIYTVIHCLAMLALQPHVAPAAAAAAVAALAAQPTAADLQQLPGTVRAAVPCQSTCQSAQLASQLRCKALQQHKQTEEGKRVALYMTNDNQAACCHNTAPATQVHQRKSVTTPAVAL
jgi:hypothetical protein